MSPLELRRCQLQSIFVCSVRGLQLRRQERHSTVILTEHFVDPCGIADDEHPLVWILHPAERLFSPEQSILRNRLGNAALAFFEQRQSLSECKQSVLLR